MFGAFLALIGLQFAGEILSALSGLPIPGTLFGMVLLLVWLIARQRVAPAMLQASQRLLQHLMLLFIPFVVGIVAQIDYIKSQWLPFVAACVLGAVISMIVTAWTFRYMLHAAASKEARRDA